MSQAATNVVVVGTPAGPVTDHELFAIDALLRLDPERVVAEIPRASREEAVNDAERIQASLNTILIRRPGEEFFAQPFDHFVKVHLERHAR